MEARRFGPLEVSVPIVGQGTWNIEEGDRARAVSALRRGLDLGMTHIDTAEMYGHGEAEKIVAEAITGRRDGVFLASKVLPSNASRSGTIRACEKSLARLRTEWLDLYLLHWPGSHPLEDTIAAFETLLEEGKIRAYGVSNFDVDDLERAVAIAGEGRIACNQVLYHLEERDIEHAVIPWCEAQTIAVVGYSPFGSGEFPSESSKGGRVLAEIARAHGATARQVALAFLSRAPLFAIPKSGDADHVTENARAARLQLTASDLERIEATFPRRAPRDALPTG